LPCRSQSGRSVRDDDSAARAAPLKWRAGAALSGENIREHLTLITLTGDEYHATIKEAADAGVIGGTIYDALIARCALKAEVEAVYTWNMKHCQQFGAAIVKRLKAL
jgi:predicted nucleic acid-binding protein